MIYANKDEETIQITGVPFVCITEFMGIFDELYELCDNKQRIVILEFIRDKYTGDFDKMFPKERYNE